MVIIEISPAAADPAAMPIVRDEVVCEDASSLLSDGVAFGVASGVNAGVVLAGGATIKAEALPDADAIALAVETDAVVVAVTSSFSFLMSSHEVLSLQA